MAEPTPTPTPTPAPTPFIEQSLGNTGFWPAVPVRAFVDGYRVSPDFREELLRQVLIAAMIATNRALESAVSVARIAGFDDLSAYIDAHEDETIGDEPTAQVLYLQAVYSHAKAAAVKPFANLQRRPGTGDEAAAAAADSFEAHHQDQHQAAIAALLNLFIPGEPHGTRYGVHVGLI